VPSAASAKVTPGRFSPTQFGKLHWMLSNITAVNSVHVAAVAAANFNPPIIAAFAASDFFVWDEALRCIHNIASVGGTTERSALLAAGVVHVLKDAVTRRGADSVMLLALQYVQTLLDDPTLTR
jgi:hypothetical protein